MEVPNHGIIVHNIGVANITSLYPYMQLRKRIVHNHYFQPQTTPLAMCSEEQICPICLMVFAMSHKPMRLRCRHQFCKDCIVQWLRRKSECPCCRDDVQKTLYREQYLPSGTRCPVCIEPLEESDSVKLECGCLFCAPCIVRLLRQDSACPVCLDNPYGEKVASRVYLLAWTSSRMADLELEEATFLSRAMPVHRGPLSSSAFRDLFTRPNTARSEIR